VLKAVSSKRRYRCNDCQWTGWRHRLKRHGGPGAADQVFNAHEVRHKEVWYFVVVMVAFALFAGVVLKQCSDEAPIPPDDLPDPSSSSVTHQPPVIEIRSLSRLPRF
jgi:hypothetical protein